MRRPKPVRVYRITLQVETDRAGARLESGTVATSGDAIEAAAMLYRCVGQRYEATFEQHGATPTGYRIVAAGLIRKEAQCASN